MCVFVANFLPNSSVKKVWKSIHICWSYGQEFGVLFFWFTVYRWMDVAWSLSLCLFVMTVSPAKTVSLHPKWYLGQFELGPRNHIGSESTVGRGNFEGYMSHPVVQWTWLITSTLHLSIFTRRMLFLTPNQQCQSTEGQKLTIKINLI